jgi:hypothetical protein
MLLDVYLFFKKKKKMKILSRETCGLCYFWQEDCSWTSFVRGPQVIEESFSSRKGDVASQKNFFSFTLQ